MKIKRFGNFYVPAIGQGTGGDDVCDDKHRVDIIKCGIESGMTLIDTAEIYRGGHAEEIIGKAVRGIRNKVFIATKFSPERHRYNSVVKALEGSLRRLRTDYIDLYQIHWPNPTVPIEETMSAFVHLKAAGKILHIGVSNFSLQNLILAQNVCCEKIESNQVEYNLLERSIEDDVLPYLKENNIMTIAYKPLLYGDKGIAVLKTMARKYEKTPKQIILNWLALRQTVIPIPRTLNFEHIRENAAASDFELEKEDSEKIDKTFKQAVSHIPTNRIRILSSKDELVYTTLKDALRNMHNLTPSPQELAKDILNHAILKPVHLRPAMNETGKFDYELIQGRLRYWAWIIAYGPKKHIPAYIME